MQRKLTYRCQEGESGVHAAAAAAGGLHDDGVAVGGLWSRSWEVKSEVEADAFRDPGVPRVGCTRALVAGRRQSIMVVGRRLLLRR